MTTETVDTISLAYDDFLASKERARKVARAEYERVLEDEQRKDREAFSRRLQIAHVQGLTKSDLRVATRQYNNPGFKDLYDAYEAAPGEFDHLSPARIAADAAEAAQQFRVVGSEKMDDGSLEWLIVENDEGDSERVFVAVPDRLDKYAKHYDNSPGAVEAARQHLIERGLL